MGNPIELLFELNQETKRLLLIEKWIRGARIKAGAGDQRVQLELDRKQAQVDQARADIEEVKKLVAMSN